ncbi:MAG: hypothetical protein ACE1ZE_05210 [Candidatus Binatia bacterium]|nr:YHS domain-containing protein [Deltaproteobacteria bacterium]MCZ6562772.1 YHS domain-containing protein [Deltaproteobacteria bacterium]MCZ6620492.1 YHS domain-containing protein [Deltaproteobacteria bacterium]
MKTPLCPPCGCSLVRLGITKEKAVFYSHKDREYQFCCNGCLELFKTDPGKYLEEISNLVVCPVCLKEKPREWTTKLDHEGMTFYFCRCPHCEDEFKKKPEHYIKRLAGVVD